jgi:hypothetical protein
MKVSMKAVLALVLIGLVAAPASANDANQPAPRKQVDRSALSADILARWSGSLRDGGAELRGALEKVSPDALAAASKADSLAALDAALFGRAVDPLFVGDTNSDLVFFPLVPCRLVDTRFVTGGPAPIVPGSPRDFEANLNLGPQGGNAAGCGVPSLDPAAIQVTITAVNPTGTGNLRAYPVGSPVPNASVVNYALPGTGLNLANTTTLPILQSGASATEFTIQADASTTHVVVDVVGYFDAGAINYAAGSDDGLSLNPMLAGTNYLISATTIAPTRTLTCLVSAEGAWFQNGGVPASGFGQIRTAMRNVTTSVNSNEGGWNNYMGSLGDNMGTGSKHTIWTLAPGATYAFGCAAFASGDFIGDQVYCTVTWFCR